ncbi:unnamed protein product [Linum tenue]|uniref:Transcriptional coactivator Hfi1/Transcriptional adapter 1 n=1 Tax=Linum tenue TaxID=586396 RepID=A0AAV0LWV7_9ROSI|nr:unnamed protein product [Linum tenue]
MQLQQSSRIDLVELKTQIVKKIGAERSKKYFFNLNRFLSQRQSKSDFDKSCFRLLGRENLPLHNQLIRGILKNACLAKIPPPPAYDVGPTKSATIQTAKSSPIRSGTTHRKIRDRPSALGTNGKVECFPHQSIGAEDGGSNNKDRRTTFIDEGEEVEQANHLTFSRNHVHAPLGLPFCLASSISGGTRKAPAAACSDDGFGICYNSGVLSDTEMLRKRMEQIAVSQGLGGVSMECANMLNNMLDVYLKRMINSCVELVGEQQRPQCSISLRDFKVAMELNPQQLGEDWPLLLERICMQSYED